MEVNVHDAETHLAELLDKVALGEEVIIARAGEPVAKLVAVEKFIPLTKPRVLGQARGMIILKPGWDDPMTEEELAEWALKISTRHPFVRLGVLETGAAFASGGWHNFGSREPDFCERRFHLGDGH